MSVVIYIKTTIFHENGDEIIEGAALGRFYEKNNASFLQYEENGEQGSIRTTVKIAGTEALILRNGAVKMRLPFALGREKEGTYELPFGKFAVFSLAKKIEHSYDDKQGAGSINLLYQFSMNRAENADTYHIEITFQEDKK